MDFDKTTYFRCMEHKFQTLTEEMNDHEVVKAINDVKSKENKANVSFIFSLKNHIGGLARALKVFEENGINVVHIESRKSKKFDSEYEIYVNLESTQKKTIVMPTLVKSLQRQLSYVRIDSESNLLLDLTPKSEITLNNASTTNDDVFDDECASPSHNSLRPIEVEQVAWFPCKVNDLDFCSKKVLLYGVKLDVDHPGFTDSIYRKRREYFGEMALKHKIGDPIPKIEYTNDEIQTWGVIFKKLTSLYPKYACKEYLENWPLLIKYCGYREDNIPQLEDVSKFLKERTGFTVRPVAGYLTPRDFLYGLAFRVFHCTQYIRHSSNPFYTPEPDCCHELLGHVPLLADPSFAQFSHEIGLAAIGASDEDIEKLATCYFFTVEFGLCRQNNELRVYGAGLLSSAAELQHVLSNEAKKLPFEPDIVCKQECLITTYQECYFYSESFKEAKEKMRQFASRIKRPYAIRYNPYNQSLEILSNTQQVSNVISDLKGDICIIFDALKKLEQGTQHDEESSNSTIEKRRLIKKYQNLEKAFRTLSIDTI